MCGRSIEPYERMASSLVRYLERAKGVKILELVIDFTIDQNKNPWFSEIKSVKSRNLTRLWDIGTPLQVEQLAN